MKIKLIKVDETENPFVRTAKKEDYVCGKEQDEEVSPFIGYYVIGTLSYPITVGKPIRMNRENRNGVKSVGLFLTSVVKSIEGNTIKTENSVYEMECL